MRVSKPSKGFTFLLLFIISGYVAKAQYTEIKDLKKDTVFNPISFLNNPGSSIKLKIIAADFYSSKMGFFCQQELKVEKSTAIPLKFRIGSVTEVDRMEGKPNTRF